MRIKSTELLILAVLLGARVGSAAQTEPEKDPESPTLTTRKERDNAPLAMSPAVVCRSISGYEDYEVLPNAAQTSEEKMLVYYRPLNYKVGRVGSSYQCLFTQDFRIRRRGEKAFLVRNSKPLKYEFKTETPPGPLFLRNMISLKGLKPGKYELELTLHDALVEESSTIQTVPFEVLPTVLPRPEPEDAEGDEDAASAARNKTKARRNGPKTTSPRR